MGTKKDNLGARFQRERLHAASQVGDLAAIEKWLAAKYPVNRFDDIGNTPLHYAVGANHMEVVNRLLAAGANVDAHDDRRIGNTPLGDNIHTMPLEMVKRLIDAGADPTIPG